MPLQEYPTYDRIGVRPLINCKGTLTMYSGSVMLPEVHQAMTEASRKYVHIEELMEGVGRRIAEVMQAEFGLVTNGCAAALCQVTAACVADTDPGRIASLPDTSGMKNEVITLKAHRHVYDHAIRMVGIMLVEVDDDPDSLRAAFNERTAMVALFGDRAGDGVMTVAEIVDIAHDHGVPVFVDAAAERPDVPNPYLIDGVDAVAYSGGKCLRGPQASGLVLGRRDLLWAAFMNGAPHHSIARPMKAGKEEIMGLLAAVEQWAQRDHEAEWKEWEGYLLTVIDAVGALPSMRTSIRQPGRSNVAPVLHMHWETSEVGIEPDEVVRLLSEGEPRVEMGGGAGLSIMPYMMEPGEDALVAARLREILEPRVK
ncbi:MAG: aminotransferase class V-fold PLP-dependent enzyme [Gemmatimonadetes bacterium]|nr:aminotransferase class V-fold PLP-dependent enzyme [Gemmatimonadota bacterium]MYG15251.1 aminotransferase class V-fold PLP-dependent enzyme [Gemmatimonadota bacterium]MYH19310.1 aminotransferase class V-fold PLP-dependent enzyme [Gemmatimonadota bacterium]MYK98815.1 aminotransferase class V-fold PLP-dependent enzyme [Gemmatimonadota bacterium]